MMHSLSRFALLLLVAGIISDAAAAPQIPSSELPGRERDRFMESPVERFMRPAPQQPPPPIELPGKHECGTRPGSTKPRSARHRSC
jgi:hypothetical protein